MIVPAHKPDEVAHYAGLDSDVTVFDLEYSVPPRCKDAARSGMEQLMKSLGEGHGEVFVRIDRDARWADTTAAVQRGVQGIVFPGAEEPGEVRELAALITAKEKAHAVEPGSIELVLMLESAKGFWNADALAAASTRVTALGVGRIDLTMQLGPVPQNEFRLHRFLMTRAVVAARMLGKQPLGAFWRPGSRGGVASHEATLEAAKEGRYMGFTGCLCANPVQVSAANEGFSVV